MFTDKIIDDPNHDIFSKMIEKGLTSEQVKNCVIDLFDDFFENKDTLKKHAVDSLLTEIVNYKKIPDNYKEEFKKCLSIFQTNRKSNEEICFKAIADISSEINKANSKYYVMYNDTPFQDIKDPEQKVEALIRNIKKVIEGLLKPYFFNLLNQIYIMENKTIKVNSVINKDLGRILDEIIQKNIINNLCEHEFLTTENLKKKLRLNHIRNILAHESYEFCNGEISCTVKKTDGTIVDMFNISIKTLEQILSDMLNKYRTIKLAYTLFFIDNVEKLITYSPDTTNIRKEQLITNYFAAIHSQGFEIIGFSDNTNKSILKLRDMTVENDEDNSRKIHSSQFLFHIWLITKANINSVEYYDPKGNLKATFEIPSTVCEKIYSGELPPVAQAELMQIKIIE